MSNEMNNLFVTESTAQAISNRGLSGTAQLTSIASNAAARIISEMNADIEQYTEDIKKSQADNNAMDALIEKVYPVDAISADNDMDFLRELSDEVLEGMLKSQQSKRSRCKSKAMTMDNYKALMVGAIAENLIRHITGKSKSSGGYRRAAGAVEYTIEQLQMLEADQEKLKKEIRNIQSKKSIMKSTTDSEGVIYFDIENKPGISNLLTIYCSATGKTMEEAEAEFVGQGYGVFKPAVGEAVVELMRPIREEAQRLLADKAYLEGVYRQGAERAQYLANKTLSKVYRKVGFLPR